ncbi:DUF262 domain-containing protein [Mucilaginibacter conchicola]|uniref:DUF262 domain-containing protein n=1 Tax=Mucilaginibacter conchicola TaxID=2303333 RepID=A0A372NQN8_9SPHI|nr:DUF262 domain-containing protein [Mucilaginibacter conchicola]RFZ91222.1 DUF262 domain-containing protein [Mucilaginibacter conchicola]
MISEEIINDNELPFRLRSVNELKGLTFLVNSYQRGYKWTAQEALDLLNDINEFDTDSGIYCLQPLVVKELDTGSTDLAFPAFSSNRVYELIDGQQRMTTIFMIMSYLNGAPDFCKIFYRTRPASGVFINQVNQLQHYEVLNHFIKDVPKLINALDAQWTDYLLNQSAEFDNVDNYHFFQVWNTIRTWFSSKSAEELAMFRSNLLDFTNFIWYEIYSEETPENVFLNINSGKIRLTNAELIKALFLISCKDISNKEVNDFRQNAIAHDWNTIENALQNPEFWYFIHPNPDKEHFPTRIDILFNIIKKKELRDKNKRDDYYTYRQYANELKSGRKLDWSKVKELFDQLTEWFDDRETYHRMGFIISQQFKTVSQLVEISKGYGKEYFKGQLKKIIHDRFKSVDGKPSAYGLTNLHYRDSPAETLAVLQLFNIETYQRSDANFRFPFYRLKQQRWSIEHIHAQQTKLFTTAYQVKLWVTDSLNLLRNVLLDRKEPTEQNSALQNRLTSLADGLGQDTLKALQKQNLAELSEELAEYLNTHKIANLALLDLKTNSAIGNKHFLDKRLVILDTDRKGGVTLNGKFESAFIPVCTKNAFLKYYTQATTDIQMEFWGAEDRKDYEAAIEEMLSDYYKP